MCSITATHNQPNSIKWPKASFWSLFCILVCNSWAFPASWLLLLIKYYFHLYEYAISATQNQPNLIKWPDTSLFALFCTIYANYASLIMQNRSDNMIKSRKLFSIIKICNMKSIKWTSLDIMAKKLIFGSLLHKLCYLWIIN